MRAKWLVIALLVLSLSIPAFGQGWQLQAVLNSMQQDISKLTTNVYRISLALDMRDVRSDKLDSLDTRIKGLERDAKDRNVSILNQQIQDSRDMVDFRSELDGMKGRLEEVADADQTDKLKALRSEVDSLKEQVSELRHSIGRAAPPRRNTTTK